MRLLIEFRVLLITRRIIFIKRDIGLSRVRRIIRRDVVFGFDVAEAEPCRGKAGNGVVEMGDAEVAAGRGVLDVCRYGFETDFGGSVGVLVLWLEYSFLWIRK